MAHIVRKEVAIRARDALVACVAEMREINEPCDHSVGICWCEYHRVMEQAQGAIDSIDAAIK